MTALIAAACSHDSDIVPENGGDVPVVPVTQETPIAFSAAQGEEQTVTRAHDTNGMTRAGTPLSESAKSFTVWGYKNDSYTQTGDVISYSDLQTVFPGYTVNWTQNSAGTTVSNSSDWEYVEQQTGSDPEQTIKYWDWGTKAYRFFGATNYEGAPPTPPATYEANKTYGAYGTYGTYESYEISMTADASQMEATPYFSTLWFSDGNPIDYPTRQFGQPVQLEFRKPFAQVRFMFTYSYQSEGIKMKKKEFKPTIAGNNIATAGTFKVIYPLTGTETRESFTTTDFTKFIEKMDKEYIPEGGEDKEIWYTVLPRSSQGSFTMGVWLNNDNLEQPATRTAVVPAEYMTWLPGYSYTYIFKITEEGGVEIELVQAAVTTPWSQTNGEHSVYNW